MMGGGLRSGCFSDAGSSFADVSEWLDPIAGVGQTRRLQSILSFTQYFVSDINDQLIKRQRGRTHG